jgi:hypothetical protein
MLLVFGKRGKHLIEKYCTSPMEVLRNASKCNTIPEKQRDLLNNKVEYNTIMKHLTYKINPTT